MTKSDNKTEKPSKKEIEKIKEKVSKTILKANISQAKEIGNENNLYFNELQDITKQIEDITKEILKLYFAEEQIKELFEGKTLNYEIVINDYEKHKKFITEWTDAVEKVNNSFVADNFFLLINNIINELQESTKEEKQKNFDALLYANTLMQEKDKLVEKFNKLDNKITSNNYKIAELQKEYQDTLQKEDIKDDNGQELKATILTSSTLKSMSLFSSYSIDEMELFKLNDRTRTQLKVFMKVVKRNKDVALAVSVKAEQNYIGKYFNIIPKEKEEITSYKPTAVKDYKVFNDKISNSLSELVNNETNIIKGTGGDSHKELEIKALIRNAEIKQSKVLTQWDKNVLEAVYSVSLENELFSLNMIKKVLSIKKYRDKAKIDKEILKSINKMTITRISLDIAEELNKMYKFPLTEERIKEMGIESYLLPLEKLYKKVGGVKQEMYKFIKRPIYFSYIDARNQILTLPIKNMQIKEISDTKENIMLKNYLLYRIKNMKYQKINSKIGKYEHYNIILYDTIFKDNELLQEKELKENEKAYNKKRDTYRATIKKILDHYIKIKVISDYKEIKEGKKYTKIEITL